MDGATSDVSRLGTVIVRMRGDTTTSDAQSETYIERIYDN
jgi:hypothetical protein